LPRIGRANDEADTVEPHSGLQGEGGDGYPRAGQTGTARVALAATGHGAHGSVENDGNGRFLMTNHDRPELADPASGAAGLILHPSVVVAPQARALFVFCAYHGRDLDRGWPRRRLPLREWTALCHRREYRDHVANPRPLTTMRRLGQRLTDVLSLARPVPSVIDAAWRGESESEAEVAGQPPAPLVALIDDGRRALLGVHVDAARPDVLVLFYPDPLGLGCAPFERQALALGLRVLVVNGRGRVFPLDRRFRRVLALRRWLAVGRWSERLFALAGHSLGTGLALYDRCRGKT